MWAYATNVKSKLRGDKGQSPALFNLPAVFGPDLPAIEFFPKPIAQDEIRSNLAAAVVKRSKAACPTRAFQNCDR
jgi:hypothetical protein